MSSVTIKKEIFFSTTILFLKTTMVSVVPHNLTKFDVFYSSEELLSRKENYNCLPGVDLKSMSFLKILIQVFIVVTSTISQSYSL